MPSEQQDMEMTVIPTALHNRLISTLLTAASDHDWAAAGKHGRARENETAEADEIRKIIAELERYFGDAEATTK